MSKPAIDPVAWSAPTAPARARVRTGADPFRPARFLPLPAPAEDVADLGGGALACSLAGGAIARLDLTGGEVLTIAETGGRPLGLEVAPDGRLLVCDSHRGLLAVDIATGRLETLVTEVGGRRLIFCSNAAAQRDGTVWFTESSSRFPFEQYLGDILEHRGTGRLLRRDPAGAVEVVLEGLQFANGLKLDAAETTLFLAETGGYSLSQVPLSGPRAGRRVAVAENLPGMPDNLSRAPDGGFWVAMVTPRNPVLDRLSGRPALRRLAWALPDALQPKPVRTVWVMKFTAEGTAVKDIEGRHQRFHFTTGVVEAGGRLYLASVESPGVLELEVS